MSKLIDLIKDLGLSEKNFLAIPADKRLDMLRAYYLKMPYGQFLARRRELKAQAGLLRGSTE